MLIQPLKKQEIESVAKITSQCFSGLKDIKQAQQWITCNFQAFPRAQYFTARENDQVIGYILWLEKGGFRKSAVFELEQIAVALASRNRGVASALIGQSLQHIKKELASRNRSLGLIEITTGVDNQAQKLYQKTLQAKPEAILTNFFSGNELIMLSRQV